MFVSLLWVILSNAWGSKLWVKLILCNVCGSILSNTCGFLSSVCGTSVELILSKVCGLLFSNVCRTNFS